MREHDEIKLARSVSKFLRLQLDRVLHHPDWNREDKLLTEVIEPILYEIAEAEAVAERNRLLRHRQEGGLFERVRLWAQQYTYELVSGINANTRKRLADAIAEHVAEPEPMETLRERVATIFSPERANLIAVTEVTRAYSAGGEQATEELRSTGLEIIERWLVTSSNPCDDCAARNGEIISGERPPLHPGCQCDTSREIA